MTTTAAAAPRTAADTPQAIAAQLLAHDGWDRDRLLAHQRERLEALLRHAVDRSPYYRETLGEAPWERPLSELPMLTKPALMEHWDAIVTRDDLTLADTAAAVAAPGYAGTVADGVTACTTSGTTGVPGIFVHDAAEMARWLGGTLRALARIGVGPQSRICSIGSPRAAHMSRAIFGGLRPGAPAPPVSVLSPIADVAAFVERQRPDVLVGYPTVYAALAEEQLRGRLDIAPRVVAVASEVLTADAAQRIHRAWGVEPRQAYPTTEAPVIASGVPDSPDMLVAEDLVIVEVVDEAGAPVAPGTPGHRVLLTSLVGRLQPLIRYELADAVTMAPPTGSLPYARITRIDGRTSDIVELPGAGGGIVRVHPHRLRDAFARVPDVAEHQLRVAPGRLTARYVPAGEARHGLDQSVERELRAELRALGAADLPVIAERVAAIPRDPAKAGKLPAVVIERCARRPVPQA